MKVDISFEFAKVYDIEKADVVIGEKFSLFTDFTDQSKWFSDNDAVLSINVKGSDADLEAKELGTSTILIMNTAFGIEKTIVIQVVDSLAMAATIGATAGPPVSK